MLSLDRIARFRAGAPALVDVSLQVAAGECIALAGGPTEATAMVLQIAATLRAPDSGVVLIRGVDARTDLYQARRHVAFASGTARCPEGLTAEEYVRTASAGRQNGADRAAVRERLALVGLDGSARVADLATPERERLALAAVCCSGAAVLLVSGGLWLHDPQWRQPSLDVIRASRDRGSAILMTTTADAALLDVASRVVRLDAGRVVEERMAAAVS